MALILSERSRTGLHDNLRIPHMFRYVRRLFLRSKMRWHRICYLILARRS
jgi:hypothetical protein